MPLDVLISPIEEMPNLADYMTTQEAAEKLGYHVVHVRRMLREGDLKGQKVGYMWFVHKPSVEEYIKKLLALKNSIPDAVTIS
jgi:excisionase family DNA binding protein